jgi:hypothetical protein
MKVTFFTHGALRERLIAQAFLQGAKRNGNRVEFADLTRNRLAGCDVACICGVDAIASFPTAAALFAESRAAGVQLVFIDKGYTRERAAGAGLKFWRIAINSNQPTRYLRNMDSSGDRFRSLGLRVRPWRASGDHVLITGGSGNYHRFAELPDPTAYATELVAAIRLRSSREIVYRPKPSWAAAAPIAGTRYSRKPEKLDDVLTGAHALVSHGSNSSFEAALAGIPSIVLGDGIGSIISSTSLDDIEAPLMVNDAARQSWLNNLAYCQWSLSEMSEGKAWNHVRRHLHA